MAKEVTPNNYIGSKLDSTVALQLTKRKEAISNVSRNINWQRAFTSKTAWVKLSSSINTSAEGSAPAYAYRLHATGITGSSDINPGYDLEKTGLGIRPVPGITNANISALNRFGTLRTATVEFKVYTIDQLDYIEQLYLRPGFSILLEWGHSVYIDNAGEVVKEPKSIGNSYFTEGAFNKDTIQKKIQGLRVSSGHNYDGMFGYIKNFSWSYNMDGSYNCTVDIVSIGEILESLKFLIPGKKKEAGDEEGDDTYKTAIHEIFRNVLDTVSSESSVGTADIDITAIEFIVGKFIDIEALERPLGKVIAAYNYKTSEEGELGRLGYISFGTIVELITKITTMYDQNGEPLSKIVVHPNAKHNTFTKHISGNPGIVMLPKGNLPLSIPAGAGKVSVELARAVNSVYKYGQLATTLNFLSSDKTSGSIRDLWVNLSHVLNVLDNSLDENKALDVLQFFRTLLVDMDKALGYITELDLAYEEEHDTYYVIDRRYTQLQDKSLTQIPVTGLGTTVSNISLTSKLSPKLGSMIAITAQASTEVGSVGVEAENMFKWNRGLTDRIVTDKTLISDRTGISPYESAQINFGTVIYELRETNQFNQSKFESSSISHQIITQSDFRTSLKQKGDAVGIIPFELSLTLDGIGGLKIGQAFKIGGRVLPKKYRDEIAFLITGLDHSIDNNRWTTTIKAQTINDPSV